jgi:serine protease AprX
MGGGGGGGGGAPPPPPPPPKIPLQGIGISHIKDVGNHQDIISKVNKLMNKRCLNLELTLGVTVLLLTGLTLSVRSAPQIVSAIPPAHVAPQVWDAAADGGVTDFLVVLADQADLSAAADQPSREARLRYVYDTLRDVAVHAQAPLRAGLDQDGVAYRAFYIVNMLAVKGDHDLVTRLAARPEVARIVANPRVRQALPESQSNDVHPLAPQAVEWNVAHINADDVWALGYTGQGIVVAGQDTGYDWDHPALINQYRGYQGTITDTVHDYNWHDAIHTGGGDCGPDSPEPCDDYASGHGTHTMGTMVGDDGGDNRIGVAPGARWIGCRNMDVGVGTPATYAECFEFFLAPYPIGGDPLTDGVPGLAPHVINNSWTCPASEGCDWDTLQMVVENVRAAGIVVIASAGNSGSSCSTVSTPIALYDAAFSVGATDSGDNIAGFSGRGPVTVDSSGRLKPDVAAPGMSIRSSRRGGGYYYSEGTSMAAPHVAGTVALLWSAAPVLIGDVDTTEQIIMQAARPHTTTQSCGGDGPADVPNNVYGWGIVDALAAVQTDIPGVNITKHAGSALAFPGAPLTFTIRVANTGNVTLTQVVLTDVLPVSATFAWASGNYTWTDSGSAGFPRAVVTWTAASLASQETLTETLVVTVGLLAPGSHVINAVYGVQAHELSTPVLGAPVEVLVPWRCALPIVLREWTSEERGFQDAADRRWQ